MNFSVKFPRLKLSRPNLSRRSVILLTCVLLLLLFIASRVPIITRVYHSVNASRYVDGVAVEDTSIRVSGRIYCTPFSNKPLFSGLFYIDCYPRSCREDMWASVSWQKDQVFQPLTYTQYGTSYPLELDSRAFISRDMTEIALGFQDGSIVATSRELYEDYQAALAGNP